MADPRRLTESKDAIPVVLYTKRNQSFEDAYPVSHGINLPPYDYVSLSISSDTETYTFKVNGASGTTVATVVVVYTSSARTDILTVTRT